MHEGSCRLQAMRAAGQSSEALFDHSLGLASELAHHATGLHMTFGYIVVDEPSVMPTPARASVGHLVVSSS